MIEIAGVHGPEYGEIRAGLTDPEARAVAARADGDGGIVAYGELPATFPSLYAGDKTIACRVMVPEAGYVKFWELCNMRLGMVPSGSGWKPTAYVVTPDGDEAVQGDEIAVSASTSRVLTATYEQATGTLTLFADGLNVGTASFGEARDTSIGLPIWQAGAAPDGWVTDGGLWAELLVPSGPGTSTGTNLPAAINALTPYLYWKRDDPTGSTEVLDYSGFGRHGTPSGTGVGGYSGTQAVFEAWAGAEGDYMNGMVTRGSEPGLGVDDASGLTIHAMVFIPSAAGNLSNWFMSRYDNANGGSTASNAEWDVLFQSNSTPQRRLTAQRWNTSSGLYQFRYIDHASSVLPEGSWKQVVIRFNSGANRPDIFVNGAKNTPGANDGTSFGTERSNGTWITSGQMAQGHFAVYQTALSDGDVAGLWTAAQADGW